MDSLAAHMSSVAELLLGAPNARLSSETQLRYGTNGSLHIDTIRGTFFDHEAQAGGGVLDLISRQANCSRDGALQWLREHGMVDDRNEAKYNGAQQQHQAASAPLGRQVGFYDYLDENDNLIFQVVRFEPKTFRQRRKDERGAWTWAVKGVRQVPYRLPEVIDAVAHDRTIFIVEGEKDADNLIRIGLPATCNAGGVGKWRNELSEFFRGADVVILQDNDPQAKTPDGVLRFHPDGRPVLPGQDHAQDVAKSLHGIARRVRVLDLAQHWPDMPPKGDVSDWIEGGGKADGLLGLADITPDWTPEPFRSRFGGLKWEQIGVVSFLNGYAWLVENIVPLGEITIAFGDSGTGKSFNIFDMAMAVARGVQWNGMNVEPGLVVYVAAEAGKGFAKRKTAYVEHFGLGKGSLPFYLMTKRPDFFHADDDVNMLIAEIEAVRQMYDEPLRLIVIDTLSAVTPGANENASQDVSMIRARLERMREAFSGAAEILVHHKPKGGSTPRGHGSLTADFETTIEYETLERLDEERRPVHRATVRKQREGRSGIMWEFTLPIVNVGTNKWGNPETSCVVQPFDPGQRNKPSGYKPRPHETVFLRALFEALIEHGERPPTALPIDVPRVVNFRYVREEMRKRMIDPYDDEEKQEQNFRSAFSRAGRSLRDVGVIGVAKPLVWYTGKYVRGVTAPPLTSSAAKETEADE